MNDFDTPDIGTQLDGDEMERAHKTICRRAQSREDYLELTAMLGLQPVEV